LRIAKTLELEGCTVELALDEGSLTGGGREIPLCEVEVELLSGSREAACVYAGALAVRFGLKQETRSKFRRALALARGE
jgi:triphosphatase